MVEHRGLEPLTSWLPVMRAPSCANAPWSHWPGSNRPPARYECAALPDELQWQIWKSITVFYYVLKATSSKTMQILWYICGTNFMPRQSLGKTLYRRPAANSKPVHISVSHLPSSRSWTPSHSCNCTKKPEIRLFCNSIFFMNIMICIFIHYHEYLYFFPLPRPHIAQIYHMHIVFYNRTIYQFAHIFCLRISQTSTPAKIHVHNFA